MALNVGIKLFTAMTNPQTIQAHSAKSRGCYKSQNIFTRTPFARNPLAGFGELFSGLEISLTRKVFQGHRLTSEGRIRPFGPGYKFRQVATMKLISEAKMQTPILSVWPGAKANTDVPFPSVPQTPDYSPSHRQNE